MASGESSSWASACPCVAWRADWLIDALTLAALSDFAFHDDNTHSRSEEREATRSTSAAAGGGGQGAIVTEYPSQRRSHHHPNKMAITTAAPQQQQQQQEDEQPQPQPTPAAAAAAAAAGEASTALVPAPASSSDNARPLKQPAKVGVCLSVCLYVRMCACVRGGRHTTTHTPSPPWINRPPTHPTPTPNDRPTALRGEGAADPGRHFGGPRAAGGGRAAAGQLQLRGPQDCLEGPRGGWVGCDGPPSGVM